VLSTSGQPVPSQSVRDPRQTQDDGSPSLLRFTVTFPELFVDPFRPRVQDGAELGGPVETRHERRGQQVVEEARRGVGVGAPPREVEGEQTQPEARTHGLAVVEFRVGSPSRIEDVGFVPVGQITPDGRGKPNDAEDDAAWEDGGGGGCVGHGSGL